MILRIPFLIMQQISNYSQAASPSEVTGIGTIKQTALDEFLVTEVFLPTQKANSCYSEFGDYELNRIITELFNVDRKRVEELRFRWHSHADGRVFWSSIDNTDINAWQASWAVNLVVNVYGEYKARFDMFQPFRIENYNMQVVIDYPDYPELREKCFQEVADKVKPLSLEESKIDPRKILKEENSDV